MMNSSKLFVMALSLLWRLAFGARSRGVHAADIDELFVDVDADEGRAGKGPKAEYVKSMVKTVAGKMGFGRSSNKLVFSRVVGYTSFNEGCTSTDLSIDCFATQSKWFDEARHDYRRFFKTVSDGQQPHFHLNTQGNAILFKDYKRDDKGEYIRDDQNVPVAWHCQCYLDGSDALLNNCDNTDVHINKNGAEGSKPVPGKRWGCTPNSELKKLAVEMLTRCAKEPGCMKKL